MDVRLGGSPASAAIARVARRIAVLGELGQRRERVDPPGVLGQAPDDRLDEERRGEARRGAEPFRSAKRGTNSGAASRWSARDVGLCWQRRATRVASAPAGRARSAMSAASSAERSFVPTAPSTSRADCSATKRSGSNASSSRPGRTRPRAISNSASSPAAAISRKSRSCGQTRRTCLNARNRTGWSRGRAAARPRLLADGGSGELGLEGAIAAELAAARERTLRLLAPLYDDELARQYSPLMSPLVWDLAHIGHFEELWLLRRLGGDAPIFPANDDVYDAFEHARDERAVARAARRRQTPAATWTRCASGARRCSSASSSTPPTALLRDGFVFGLVVQHEQQHVETMLQTLQLSGLRTRAAARPPSGRARTARRGGHVQDGHGRGLGLRQRAAGARGRGACVSDRLARP